MLDGAFLQEIKDIWKAAKSKAYTLDNRSQIDAYWQIGRRILKEEQKGAKRAEYGRFWVQM